MRKYFTILLVTIGTSAYGQTNTFPLSGNVGIGTTTPGYLLELKSNNSTSDIIAIKRNDVSPNVDIYSVYSGSDDIQQGSFGYGVRPSDNAWQIWERPVGGNWNNLVSVVSGGNVGIGTSTPSQKLEVNGHARFAGEANAQNGFRVGNWGIGDNTNSAPWYGLGASNIVLPGGQGNGAVQLAGFFGLNLQTAYGQMVMTALGNIGIGTTNPQSKLAVNGIITTKEVNVTTTGWPDYVFDSSYELKSLAAVANYIQENKHLPNIPSADEVSKNGIALGEMNKKLLEKVEELTLYMIEMKKENNDLKHRLEKLENKK